MKGIYIKKNVKKIKYDDIIFYNTGRGYFYSSDKIALHRYIWEKYNGPIKKGFIIHHITGNTNNNLLINLKKMTQSKHAHIHHKNPSKKKRELLASYRLGKKHSQETKEYLSKINSRKVMCIDTGIIYDSLLNAEKDTGAKYCNISLVCSGYRKTAGGYHWTYIDDEAIS